MHDTARFSLLGRKLRAISQHLCGTASTMRPLRHYLVHRQDLSQPGPRRRRQMQRIAKVHPGLVPRQRTQDDIELKRFEVRQRKQVPQSARNGLTVAVFRLQHPDQFEQDGRRCGECPIFIQQGGSGAVSGGVIPEQEPCEDIGIQPDHLRLLVA